MLPEDRTITALAGINLLGLASDVGDYRANREADRRGLTGASREAFIAGALWVAQLYTETVLANMPPDGPQPDGTQLFTNRPGE